MASPSLAPLAQKSRKKGKTQEQRNAERRKAMAEQRGPAPRVSTPQRREGKKGKKLHLIARKKKRLLCPLVGCGCMPVSMFGIHICRHVGHIVVADACLLCGVPSTSGVCKVRARLTCFTEVDLGWTSQSDEKKCATNWLLAPELDKLRLPAGSDAVVPVAQVIATASRAWMVAKARAHHLIIMWSSTKGLYVITSLPMRRGDQIPVAGFKTTVKQREDLQRQMRGGSYSILDKEGNYWPTGVGALFNHACGRRGKSPCNMSIGDNGAENRSMEGPTPCHRRWWLEATRDIDAGEELLWDYLQGEKDAKKRKAGLRKFFGSSGCCCATCA